MWVRGGNRGELELELEHARTDANIQRHGNRKETGNGRTTVQACTRSGQGRESDAACNCRLLLRVPEPITLVSVFWLRCGLPGTHGTSLRQAGSQGTIHSGVPPLDSGESDMVSSRQVSAPGAPLRSSCSCSAARFASSGPQGNHTGSSLEDTRACSTRYDGVTVTSISSAVLTRVQALGYSPPRARRRVAEPADSHPQRRSHPSGLEDVFSRCLTPAVESAGNVGRRCVCIGLQLPAPGQDRPDVKSEAASASSLAARSGVYRQ
ncbi:hypothetical protein K466DRAFT_9466 [Polyporus arcularius HHB13444]|uniref:Uncharacterized protein n=1 Tax=Polyporus arcularius HHB13444 TaxID=1314778 RepID=A0A5C3NQL7_9APHY|nr:hypothetical protein K466DRAFT_9466 [Polyporus arcularius HHB13444]